MKTLETDFGRFTFLDRHTVVAEARKGVNIDGNKVKEAILLIEQELPGDYAMILDRKADYSVAPVEVYRYFASIQRLKAIAIVNYHRRGFLPEDMERRLYGGEIESFTSIAAAHDWVQEKIVSIPFDIDREKSVKGC